jgi:hypothetical protein
VFARQSSTYISYNSENEFAKIFKIFVDMLYHL